MTVRLVLVTFLITVTKYVAETTSERKDLFWLTVSEFSPWSLGARCLGKTSWWQEGVVKASLFFLVDRKQRERERERERKRERGRVRDKILPTTWP
jgi:hypothetical protein